MENFQHIDFCLEYIVKHGAAKSVGFLGPLYAVLQYDHVMSPSEQGSEISYYKLDIVFVEKRTSWDVSYWVVQACFCGGHDLLLFDHKSCPPCIQSAFARMGRTFAPDEARTILTYDARIFQLEGRHMPLLDGDSAVSKMSRMLIDIPVLVDFSFTRGVCANDFAEYFNPTNFRKFVFDSPASITEFRRTVFVFYVTGPPSPYFLMYKAERNHLALFAENDPLPVSMWKVSQPLAGLADIPVDMRYALSGTGVTAVEPKKSAARTSFEAMLVRAAEQFARSGVHTASALQ